MLSDLRVLDVGDELLLSCERAGLQELFNMIRRYKLGADVELHKRTMEMGELSLIGPEARRVAGADELGPDEHDNVRATIGEHDVILVATDLGVDVFCDAEATEGVRGALLAAGAVEVTEAAAELVRVESGRPRFGVDLDDNVIPQEAGLNDRAVSFTKGCYVGQETVARLFYRGKPNRHLRGLKLSAEVEPGTPLLLGEKEVGRVTSVAVSPAHGPIGLALVRRQAEPGSTIAAGENATAEVVDLPFS
jgi:folate-binding protein YgfZ